MVCLSQRDIIFLRDDAWFQENMGDFREKYGLRCVLHGFSVPMKVEEK